MKTNLKKLRKKLIIRQYLESQELSLNGLLTTGLSSLSKRIYFISLILMLLIRVAFQDNRQFGFTQKSYLMGY